MKFILRWLIGAFAFLGAAYIVPGIEIESFYIALIVAFVWGVISSFIKPIVHIFALPITILTLGLFSFVINGLLFWLMSTFVKGFVVEGFWVAVLGAVVVSILGWIGRAIFIPKDDK